MDFLDSRIVTSEDGQTRERNVRVQQRLGKLVSRRISYQKKKAKKKAKKKMMMQERVQPSTMPLANVE